MEKVWKSITLFTVIIISVFVSKVDAHAEVIWNTSGELNPWGGDYKYKYWSGTQWIYDNSGTISNPSELIDIAYDVTYCYEEAYKMNAYVNEQRRKEGVPEVQMKDEIMDVAMKRAAQTALYWEHICPDGTGHETASMYIDGENLHVGSCTAKAANNSLVNSPGHYQNIIDDIYEYAGYGCVKVNDEYYWVQVFSSANKYYEDGYDMEYHIQNDKYVNGVKIVNASPNDRPVEWDKMVVGTRADYTARFVTKVNPALISLKSVAFSGFYSSDEIIEGEIAEGRVYTYYYNKYADWSVSVLLTPDQYDVKVLTPAICSYNNGMLTALTAGTAKIQFTLKADNRFTTILELTVKDKPVKKGNAYNINNDTYKVTNTSKMTVEFKQSAESRKSVTIPKTVKINGKTYKVTSVCANAFKSNKTLQSVTIGANITKIGKNAFYGCKNLKKITVKSTKLKTVGKNALKGIHKKAVIKVPKSKLKTYKKLLSGKGQKKTVKIKK